MGFAIRPNLMPLLMILLLASCLTVRATGAFGMVQYEEYKEAVMQVKGTLEGIQVSYNGTFQQVLSQFSSDHPDVTIEVNHTATAAKKLDSRNKSGLLCCPIAAWGWNHANQLIIFDEILWLEGRDVTCGVEARSCARVSCEWDSAIYLCNDNDYHIAPSCAYIGSYANDILDACHWNDHGVLGTCGQEFDSDAYNVIVRKDAC